MSQNQHIKDMSKSSDNLLDHIIGQATATRMLRLALEKPVPSYMFVGPSNTTMREIAYCFAGELLAKDANDPQQQRYLAHTMQHPDITTFDRVGPAITAEQARDAIRLASIAPASGEHKIIILCDMHTAKTITPILLKAVEEPSPSTTFILLTESTPPHLDTLLSRCVRINFQALTIESIINILLKEGGSPEIAAAAARASNGSISRARLLLEDNTIIERMKLWESLLTHVDGFGGTSATLIDEILAALEKAEVGIKKRHKSEITEAKTREKEYAQIPLKNSDQKERHKRELRKHKNDEVLLGVSIITDEIRKHVSSGELLTQTAASYFTAARDMEKAIKHNGNLQLALHQFVLSLGIGVNKIAH